MAAVYTLGPTASFTLQREKMPLGLTLRRLRICSEKSCASVPTDRSPRPILSTTQAEPGKKSGRWGCAIHLRLRFSREPVGCSLTMSGKARGKKLMTASPDRITDGLLVKAPVRHLTPTFEIHYFNTVTAQAQLPAAQ